MNLSNLAQMLGQLNVKFSLEDVLNLISGQPLNIQVDPFNEPNVLGKTLTVALMQNAIQVQLH